MNVNKSYKSILLEYLKIISHVANKDYQKRVWIEHSGPEYQAFDDAVCDFFDIGDPILNEYEKFGISELQFDLLKKISIELEQFSNMYDLPQQFIDTPEWTKITFLAQEVLRAFDYPDTGVD